MPIFDPYGKMEGVKEQQPLLYGPTGEPISYQEPEEQFSPVGEPIEEGAAEELFGERARLELEQQALLKKAKEEEKRKERAAKAEEEALKKEIALRKGEVELRGRAQRLVGAQQTRAIRGTGETPWGAVERYAGRARQVGKVAGTGVRALSRVKMGRAPTESIKSLYFPTPRAQQVEEGIPPSRPVMGVPGTSVPLGTGEMLISRVVRGSFGTGASPIAQLARSSVGLVGARLGPMVVPRGLTRIEQIVFQTIEKPGNVDVPSQIADELAQLGVNRQEALNAIGSLIRKGHVQKSGELGGEPMLEAIR